MIIFTTGILLYAKVCPIYKVMWECIVVVNTYATLFTNRSVHVESSELTCVQNFRSVPLTGFEILGFKLKNKNDKKKN